MHSFSSSLHELLKKAGISYIFIKAKYIPSLYKGTEMVCQVKLGVYVGGGRFISLTNLRTLQKKEKK